MPAENPLQVFVVDDHTVVRVGVRDVLERTGDYQVVAEASGLAQALERLCTLPDTAAFLITEVQLQADWTFELIRAARLRRPSLEVILLSASLNGWSLRRALDAGARGFVPKEAESGALLEALSCLRRGHVYLDPRLGSTILDAIVLPESIERQESDERLLTLLAGGLTDRDISRATGRPRTVVSREISLLRRRLGASTRAAAVNMALRRGMLA
jgi:two-component system response regulator DevR